MVKTDRREGKILSCLVFMEQFSLEPVPGIAKCMTDQIPFNADIVAKVTELKRNFSAFRQTLQSFQDSVFVILSESDLAEEQIFYQISQK